MGAGCARHIASRLVEREVDCSGSSERLSVHGDYCMAFGRLAERGGLAIDRNSPLAYEILGASPRGNARPRQKLVYSLGHRWISRRLWEP